MLSWFRKEKWAHVKTFTIDNIKYDNRTDGKVFIHLYESDKGNRKIDNACSYPDAPQDRIDNFVRSTDLFQTKLLRWWKGRYDPEIPRYSQIGEEDTVNALKGTIE